MDLSLFRRNAMYLRKSRQDEGGVEETLRKHKEILLEFAANNNLQIAENDIYKETISGESLFARPQMLKLLQEIENGMYDSVLCIDVDRLGRGGMSDQGIIFETFKNNNTRIITPRKVYDLNDEFDEDNIEFESFMARRELKIIKRRLRRGTKKSIQEGCWLANAPYGYRRTVVGKKHTLEIVEEEAKIVRMIFDMYANKGMGGQSIADALTAMGAKPHRRDRFERTSVLFILRNSVYIGKVSWDKKTHIRKNSRGNEKHITIYNPKEKWTVVDGLHPPIIDMETWDKAQEILKQKSHPPSNTGEIKNPLSHLLYCGNCGKLMTRQVTKGVEYYRCLNRGCIKSTQAKYVNERVTEVLKNNFEEMVIDIAEQHNAVYVDYSDSIKEIRAEIKKIEAQKNVLHDFLEQGIYDIPTFMERQKVLNIRLIAHRQRLEELNRKTSNNRIVDKEKMISLIQQFLEVIDTASPQEKNEMLRTFIEKIIYRKNKEDKLNEVDIEIHLKPLFY